MTLEQFLTLVSACEPTEVRRAMVAVLACQCPRTPSDYRRFYSAVSVRLALSTAPIRTGSRPSRAAYRDRVSPRALATTAPSY